MVSRIIQCAVITNTSITLQPLLKATQRSCAVEVDAEEILVEQALKLHEIAASLRSFSPHAYSLEQGCLHLCSDKLDVRILMDIG